MTISTPFRVRCAAVLLVLAAACSVGHAQVLYGSLTGNVTDPTDAAIPGARVEVLNAGTGVSRQAETDGRGGYLFSNLQLGSYKITVESKGFQTTIMDNVTVNANEVRRVDFRVQIAQAIQTVEVAANAAVLQTDKSDVRHEITAQQVEELPYNGGEGKNFQSLLYLMPGAGIIANVEANSEAGNPQRAQTLFMNGVSSTGNSTKLDGATVSYPWLPVNIAYVPPSEAIEAVNVSTNAFDAEQGAAGGAAVNVTIKSGTNELHGVLFERNQNNDMTAVNYFSHTQPLDKNIFNQYGFAVGGPVWIPKIIHGKNKLFFFADYQGTKRRQYAASTQPDAAYRGHAHRRLQRAPAPPSTTRSPAIRTARAARRLPTTSIPDQPHRPCVRDADVPAAHAYQAERVHQQLRRLRQHPVQPRQLGFQGQLQSHPQTGGVGPLQPLADGYRRARWFWDPRRATRSAAAIRGTPAAACRRPRPASPIPSRRRS